VAPVIAALVQQKLGLKYHWAVADYLQRAARHIASKTDVEQAYAMGKAAVELALEGKNAVMPTIVRKSDDPYAWEVGYANLADVANVEKMMPREYVTEDGLGITEACRRYLQPLILGEDYPPYKNGMPDYVTLRNSPVPRKLSTTFDPKA
jgi:6-phosphofructokinase 1